MKRFNETIRLIARKTSDLRKLKIFHVMHIHKTNVYYDNIRVNFLYGIGESFAEFSRSAC